jgi:hypothetical protein
VSGDNLPTTSLTSETGEIERVNHCPVEDPHVTIVGARTDGLNGVRWPFVY